MTCLHVCCKDLNIPMLHSRENIFHDSRNTYQAIHYPVFWHSLMNPTPASCWASRAGRRTMQCLMQDKLPSREPSSSNITDSMAGQRSPDAEGYKTSSPFEPSSEPKSDEFSTDKQSKQSSNSSGPTSKHSSNSTGVTSVPDCMLEVWFPLAYDCWGSKSTKQYECRL